LGKRNVLLKCPICQTPKEISVPNELFEQNSTSLIKIQIEKGICCQHQFIAFFNKAGKNCGYEKLDLTFKLENLAPTQKMDLQTILNQFGENITTRIFHSVVLKIPILILYTSEKQQINSPKLNTYFNDVLSREFQSPLLFYSESELDYKNHPKNNMLVISSNNKVLNLPWPQIALEYETKIITEALKILDSKTQPLIIQEFLRQLLLKATFLKDFLSDVEKIDEEVVINKLNLRFEDEIDEYIYLFLLQILEFRFFIDLDKIQNQIKRKKKLFGKKYKKQQLITDIRGTFT
jgi:hypothetical protein